MATKKKSYFQELVASMKSGSKVGKKVGKSFTRGMNKFMKTDFTKVGQIDKKK